MTGPLTRIRRGEASPKIEQPNKPREATIEPETKPTKREQNRARLQRRKARRAEQRDQGLLPPLTTALMSTPQPEGFSDALTWIGTKMARQGQSETERPVQEA